PRARRRRRRHRSRAYSSRPAMDRRHEFHIGRRRYASVARRLESNRAAVAADFRAPSGTPEIAAERAEPAQAIDARCPMKYFVLPAIVLATSVTFAQSDPAAQAARRWRQQHERQIVDEL